MVTANQRSAQFGHPLALVRHTMGWSYQGLVDEIARQAARMPEIGNMAARREKAWRWEHWGVVPDRGTQLALAALLGVPRSELDRCPWPRWLPAGDRIRADHPWTTAGNLATLGETLECAVDDRRGFLVLADTPLGGLVGQWLSVEPAKVEAVVTGRDRADSEILDWIEARVSMLRRMDDRLGGTRLRHLVDAELRLVVGLLASGGLGSALTGRLCRASAEVAQLGGWVSFDVGLHAAAQRYYVAALHAAQQAGDRLLGASVLAGMSLQSTTMGEPGDGLALAQASVEGAGGVATPRVQAMLATREARAQAALGDQAACAAALTRAHGALDRAAPGDPDPGWIYYFDGAELAAQAGACWLELRSPPDAVRYLDDALRRQDPAYVRDRAIYHIRLASAQVAMGEMEAGCATAAEGVTLAQRGRSPRSLAAARELRRRLEPWRRERPVRELDDVLATSVA
ncbi:MAG: transcriptional regulator [Actinobacteria bacterium]|nr:transcriptional regulator [Actinomycetota bacterium]MBI3687302.1 transcriptional regulator [Actinomycetota bacterium]